MRRCFLLACICLFVCYREEMEWKGEGGREGKGREKNAVERWINVCIAYGVHFYLFVFFYCLFYDKFNG